MHISDWVALASAFAALLTFWVMLTTARRQLRAYIGVGERVTPSERHLVLQSDGSIKSLALATNFGQTPAYNVMSRCYIGYADSPLPKSFPFPELVYKNAGPLFPSDTMAIEARGIPQTPLAPGPWMATLKPVGAAQQTWYVYGFITYDDVYGTRRYTRFCYAIWWNDGPGHVPSWYNAPHFNDADSDIKGWKRWLRFVMP